MRAPIVAPLDTSPRLSPRWLIAATWAIYLLCAATSVPLIMFDWPPNWGEGIQYVGMNLTFAALFSAPLHLGVLLWTGRLGRRFAMPLMSLVVAGGLILALAVADIFWHDLLNRQMNRGGRGLAFMLTFATSSILGLIIGWLLSRRASGFGKPARRWAWMGALTGLAISGAIDVASYWVSSRNADDMTAFRIMIPILGTLVSSAACVVIRLEYPPPRRFEVLPVQSLAVLLLVLMTAGCHASGGQPSTRPAPTSPIPPYSGPEYSQLHQQLRGPLPVKK